MHTDSRFVDLVLMEVRINELRDLIRFLNQRLYDYETELKEISSKINNTQKVTELNTH